jgi:hypothetical protein
LFRSGRDWIQRTVSAWPRQFRLTLLSIWPRQFRLTLLSIAVGVVAGVGAVLFDHLLTLALELLHMITGYMEPGRGADPSLANEITTRHSFWFLSYRLSGGWLPASWCTASRRRRRDTGPTR